MVACLRQASLFPVACTCPLLPFIDVASANTCVQDVCLFPESLFLLKQLRWLSATSWRARV